MFQKAVSVFDRILRRYTPDPYVLALLLTFTLFVIGVSYTPTSATQMITYWGEGFWTLIPFTFQMVMVLFSGYMVALTPFVNRKLTSVAMMADTSQQAIVLITFTSLIASFLNWGLGLVVGGLLCQKMRERFPKGNYRLMVASSYSGFLVWHGGLSASIPLVLATEGNFSQSLVGGLIPVSETLLSPLNIAAVMGLFILLPILNRALHEPLTEKEEEPKILQIDYMDDFEPIKVPVDWLEKTPIVSSFIGLVGVIFVIVQIFRNKFNFDLNTINFIFLFLSIMLHKTPASLIRAMHQAAGKVGPVLLQFPFYAAIMSMMLHSGIGKMVSDFFVLIATPGTFNFWTFMSAGLVNLFVPSGGGQWAVQSPIVLEGARALNVDFAKAALAVAWGDAWTNMLQPFWALPLLSIAGLQLRDIMGYCLTILIVSGVFLGALFLFF